MAIAWHTKKIEKLFEEFSSGTSGLSNEKAQEVLKERGLNVLPKAKTESLAVIFLRQFQSPLIYILLAACCVVFTIKEFVDGIIILAVLLFNAIVGVIQEGKAQNTLRALKDFVKTKATVLRGGVISVIDDTFLAEGDIALLQEGDKAPADCRIISCSNLKVDEASLTGESTPVLKNDKVLVNKELAATEQKNMVFKGTNVVSGNARGLVVATGERTVIGKISKKIIEQQEEIPLQKNIRYLSRAIIVAAVLISGFLFILGLKTGKPLQEIFLTVVSLAVSIIPEGLIVVLTLILASGVWRMSKRNVLVKKLQAVEALGQARVIAVDKTGTITKNELLVEKVFSNNQTFEITGSGYEPKGQVKLNNQEIDPLNHPELILMGKIAAFCSTAQVIFSDEKKQWIVNGDPTEGAMLVFADKIGFKKDQLLAESPILAEIPFDYKLKYHAVKVKIENQSLIMASGAPETILELCSFSFQDGSEKRFSKKQKEAVEQVFYNMSQDGLRVIALATNWKNTPFAKARDDFKTAKSKEKASILKPEEIKSLVFAGFIAMQDTIRPEAKNALERAKSAGVKVVMVTGDNKITAKAIAEQVGIFKEGDAILTGKDIDDLLSEGIAKKAENVSVFARVTPEHKLRIIQAFKKRGEIIAMTGDGVNDAPSLVAADLGVAMGKMGTEVAREASDLILLDDNFGSIVSAIEEGRSIYKTIKKVILYLFSTSVGEVLTICLALTFGWPIPLLAAQIIWLNFVTDGFLDVALAQEPKEKNLLSKSFEKPKKYLLNRLALLRMITMALPMAAGALFIFSKYYQVDIVKAQTMCLTVLAMFQWFNAFNCKSETESVFKRSIFDNRFLIFATLIVIALQLFAVYSPFMQNILKTTPLSLSDWLLIIPIAFSIILVEELRKLIYRKTFALRLAIKKVKHANK